MLIKKEKEREIKCVGGMTRVGWTNDLDIIEKPSKGGYKRWRDILSDNYLLVGW